MQNAILADEMGLGKTIQVIGLLAALKEIHGCWPFLVVVPNSTCPNWRREIKQWAPSLRVVLYYGSAEARKLAFKHELFSEGNKNLGCHVVVTSYDAAQDHEFRRIFRGVHWAGLVVDEGQRLKNDKSILYGALNALKPPFKLLLTGMYLNAYV
jgi:chromodomain-helicase-DNA-binding protein 4